MARTKITNTQNSTKHAEHQNATYIKNYLLGFRIFLLLILIYDFFNDFFKKCWVTALVRSMTFNGCLNQF